MRKGTEIAIVVLLAIIVILLALMLITGIEKAPDLTGEWVQMRGMNLLDYIGSNEYYSAKIHDDIIEVYVNNDEGRSVLYWSGSYVKPKTNKEPYTWTSINEYRITESLIFPIRDEGTDFSYNDGMLSFYKNDGSIVYFSKRQ